MSGPIDQVLAAIGIPDIWSTKAHGPALREDWRLGNNKSAAVMELKTSAVLTGTKPDLMTDSLDQFSIKMLPLPRVLVVSRR